MASIKALPNMFRALKRHVKLTKTEQELPSYSRDFPFFRDRKTANMIKSSKVFFLLRGLPGSGKSTVVRALKTRFKNAITCSADDYFVQEDGQYVHDAAKLPAAHKSCKEKTQRSAEKGSRHIIVDNTNIERWEMTDYLRIANAHDYLVLLLEPKTPWRLNPEVLAVRNIHDVPQKYLEQKKKKFNPIYPMYWGWFLNEKTSEELLSLGENVFALCVKHIPEFAEYMTQLGSSNGLGTPMSFKDYYHRKGGNILHCTSFYSGSGKNRDPRTKDYASLPKVQHSHGRASDLKLLGVFITPRTVGIRVNLSANQLGAWGGDDVWTPQIPPKLEGKVESSQPAKSPHSDNSTTQSSSQSARKRHNSWPMSQKDSTSNLEMNLKQSGSVAVETNKSSASLSNGEKSDGIRLEKGSRAHITLGYADGYTAVQTGLDQMELLLCEDSMSTSIEPIITDDVTIMHYGKGRCAVYLDWPLYKPALFTGKY